MRTRIGLSTALVMILAMLIPSTALSVKPIPFYANGIITEISSSNEFQSGQSGRIVVVERSIYGSFSEGDIADNFSMTYRANVEMTTQAGNFNGTLETGSYVFLMNGKSQPLTIVPVNVYGSLPKLEISGQWILIDGAEGQGVFNGWFIFIPTPEGHIAAIIDSSFVMTGQWHN